MQPGQGSVRALVFAESVTTPRIGGSVEYQHRVTDKLSLYGTGFGAAANTGGGKWSPEFGVGAGLRVDW